MTIPQAEPFCSVIVPTRNRAATQQFAGRRDGANVVSRWQELPPKRRPPSPPPQVPRYRL